MLRPVSQPRAQCASLISNPSRCVGSTVVWEIVDRDGSRGSCPGDYLTSTQNGFSLVVAKQIPLGRRKSKHPRQIVHITANEKHNLNSCPQIIKLPIDQYENGREIKIVAKFDLDKEITAYENREYELRCVMRQGFSATPLFDLDQVKLCRADEPQNWAPVRAASAALPYPDSRRQRVVLRGKFQ